MSAEVGRVPEALSTKITAKLLLRIVGQHVLVQAPAPPTLKLLSTHLDILGVFNANFN